MTREDICWMPSAEYRRSGYGVVQVEDADDDSYVKGCIDRFDNMRRGCEGSSLSGVVVSFSRCIVPVIRNLSPFSLIRELLAAQPMGVPSGEVFYADFAR